MKSITQSELIEIGNEIFEYLLPMNENTLVCPLGWYLKIMESLNKKGWTIESYVYNVGIGYCDKPIDQGETD